MSVLGQFGSRCHRTGKNSYLKLQLHSFAKIFFRYNGTNCLLLGRELKWTDLQSTVIWLGMLTGMLGLTRCSWNLWQKIPKLVEHSLNKCSSLNYNATLQNLLTVFLWTWQGPGMNFWKLGINGASPCKVKTLMQREKTLTTEDMITPLP